MIVKVCLKMRKLLKDNETDNRCADIVFSGAGGNPECLYLTVTRWIKLSSF